MKTEIDYFSFVVPCYNESANIRNFITSAVSELKKLNLSFEIIVVDDGSTDNSDLVYKTIIDNHPEVVLIKLDKNLGQHEAVLNGFKHSKGDYIITLDADLIITEDIIKEIIEKLKTGIEIVGTKRINRKILLSRKILSKIANFVINLIIGKKYFSDYGSMLRGYSRNVINQILANENKATFIPIAALLHSKSTTEIEIPNIEKRTDNSRYTFNKLIALQKRVFVQLGMLKFQNFKTYNIETTAKRGLSQ